MRFVGIDVASERHVVAVIDESDRILLKATPFTEDADGYAKLLEVLGASTDALVAMEATGHYWKNLFAALAAGFAVALVNPLRTRRFAGEDLQRTQTDAIDAVGIARFAAQKRPTASRLPDGAIEELRELVRFRDRLRQDFGDRVRQLHRLVDLGFPEFTRHVRELGSELATALLRESPTARPGFTACRCVARRSGRAGASRCSPRCCRSCCGGFSPKREFWQGIYRDTPNTGSAAGPVSGRSSGDVRPDRRFLLRPFDVLVKGP